MESYNDGPHLLVFDQSPAISFGNFSSKMSFGAFHVDVIDALSTDVKLHWTFFCRDLARGLGTWVAYLRNRLFSTEVNVHGSSFY